MQFISENAGCINILKLVKMFSLVFSFISAYLTTWKLALLSSDLSCTYLSLMESEVLSIKISCCKSILVSII